MNEPSDPKLLEKTPSTLPDKLVELMLQSIPGYLESYGSFVLTTGQIEKQLGTTLKDLPTKLKMDVDDVIKALPQEIALKFLTVLFKLSNLSKGNMEDLSADEKIEEGTQLMQISRELSSVSKQIIEALKEGGISE